MKVFLVLNMRLSILIIVALLTLVTTGVGGDNTDPYGDDSNVNGDSSLCRVVRDAKKALLTSFRHNYTVSNTYCDIVDHCANVTCTAEFSRGRVNGGVLLKLCEEDPELIYWADFPGHWDQPWNYTFSSKNFNGLAQRKEITGNSNETKPTRWFIKVLFSITHGRNRINQGIKYISALSELQICQSASVSEETCTNATLLNFPRLPQSQICEYPVLSLSDIGDDGHHREIGLLRQKPSDINGNYPSSTRSSRNANANAFDPSNLHRQAGERVKKYENGQLLKAAPGDSCDTHDIFGCGPGANCVLTSDGSGICECRPGFAFNATSHVCEKRAPSPFSPSDDPSSADSLNSRSYSSAVGAILSILILIGIAAGIYFGTKYNYFTRIRHRLPVFRCWPFRRSQPWEDNVTMVNPLGPPDDDDPLLL